MKQATLKDKGVSNMRDKIKDKKYFEDYIEDLSDEIMDFEKFLQQIIKEKGDSFKGVKSGYETLRFYYLNKIKALYSNGEDIEEIKKLYPRILEYLVQYWKLGSGIDILINVISLGVLLNIDDDQIKKITEFLKQQDIDDIIIDFLASKVDSDWIIKNEDVKYPEIYEVLGNIIKENDEVKQVELLKQYLDEWYHRHDFTAWHDSHKSKHNTYNGYWSFEAGAIAKALGLDDNSLKDHQYYPYDLVHFKG